jgi:hypothetical protein
MATAYIIDIDSLKGQTQVSLRSVAVSGAAMGTEQQVV